MVDPYCLEDCIPYIDCKASAGLRGNAFHFYETSSTSWMLFEVGLGDFLGSHQFIKDQIGGDMHNIVDP